MWSLRLKISDWNSLQSISKLGLYLGDLSSTFSEWSLDRSRFGGFHTALLRFFSESIFSACVTAGRGIPGGLDCLRRRRHILCKNKIGMFNLFPISWNFSQYLKRLTNCRKLTANSSTPNNVTLLYLTTDLKAISFYQWYDSDDDTPAIQATFFLLFLLGPGSVFYFDEDWVTIYS